MFGLQNYGRNRVLFHVICCRQCLLMVQAGQLTLTLHSLQVRESQQRVRAKTLPLSIKKTTEWIGTETLARYAIRKFN